MIELVLLLIIIATAFFVGRLSARDDGITSYPYEWACNEGDCAFEVYSSDWDVLMKLAEAHLWDKHTTSFGDPRVMP